MTSAIPSSPIKIGTSSICVLHQESHGQNVDLEKYKMVDLAAPNNVLKSTVDAECRTRCTGSVGIRRKMWEENSQLPPNKVGSLSISGNIPV